MRVKNSWSLLMNSYIRTEHIKEYIILEDKKVLEPNGQDSRPSELSMSENLNMFKHCLDN